MTPGSALRQLRQDQGITQAQLAAAAGVRRDWIAAVEQGRVMNPGTAPLAKLARALGMSTSHLAQQMGLAPLETPREDPEVSQKVERFFKLLGQLDQSRRKSIIDYITSINELLGAEVERATAEDPIEPTATNQPKPAAGRKRHLSVNPGI